MGALRYSRRPTVLTPLIRFIPLVILVLASGPTEAQQRAGMTELIDFLTVRFEVAS